jgi:hypothetical protein
MGKRAQEEPGFQNFRLWFGNAFALVLFEDWDWWFMAGGDHRFAELFSCAIAGC